MGIDLYNKGVIIPFVLQLFTQNTNTNRKMTKKEGKQIATFWGAVLLVILLVSFYVQSTEKEEIKETPIESKK